MCERLREKGGRGLKIERKRKREKRKVSWMEQRESPNRCVGERVELEVKR